MTGDTTTLVAQPYMYTIVKSFQASAWANGNATSCCCPRFGPTGQQPALAAKVEMISKTIGLLDECLE